MIINENGHYWTCAFDLVLYTFCEGFSENNLKH